MRCRTAQEWMVAGRDGELGGRRRRALDRHLGRCEACRAEQASVEGVLRLLDGLPGSAEVPAGLEQRVLRTVRLLADEEQGRPRWWALGPVRSLVPALAASAAVLLAVVGLRGDETPLAPADAPAVRAAAPAPAVRATAPAPEPRRAVATARAVPDEPPAELAMRPELFMDLPLLDDFEKIEHFEAIVGIGDAADPAAGAGNG